MTRENYAWLNADSRLYLSRGYLQEGETAEGRIRRIAERAEAILGIEGFADRFEHHMARGHFSLASPIWANFGTDRGLPISCFGSHVEDNMPSILHTHAEIGAMSKFGGGTSAYLGNLRPRGAPISGTGTSFGPIHFAELFQTLTSVVSQGNVRRGQCAVYLDIEHPDIEEWLKIRTEGNPIQHLPHGVCVGDVFIDAMLAGDREKRRIWTTLIQRRMENGLPYVIFRDNATRGTVDVYRDHDLPIRQSNLCTEIFLPNGPDESFVCDLSSLNLLHWDEIVESDAVETLTFFLDAVMSEFIEKLEAMRDSERREDRQAFAFMRRAHTFAKRHRALGLGVLGWHSLLQARHMPFDGREAAKLNRAIAKEIETRAWRASAELAKRFGEPEVLAGYGRRNTTLTAIAPTKSSSFILGQVSQSVEPEFGNYYAKDLQKARKIIRNPHLERVLERHGMNTQRAWKAIRDADGSVQGLDGLPDDDKAVFKTFTEIDPYAIVDQAIVRQQHVDQGQSLNLSIHPRTDPKAVNNLHLHAWRGGLKSLYYQFSLNASQELARERTCTACEA